VRRPRRVVVIGGGITGLTAAYRLGGAGGNRASVTLAEAGDRVGGKLRAVVVDGLEVEGGADSFVVRKRFAVDLCTELGLADELVVPASQTAFVWSRGRLVPFPPRSAFGVPSTVRDLLAWPGLSLPGRVRAAADLLRPARRSTEDESIGSLAKRRLGREAARVLVGPVLAGIHAGDPEHMSVLATFPELARWEGDHGSLIRGARAARRVTEGRAPPLFAAVWGGMSRLVGALAEAVGPGRIRLDSPVRSVRRERNGAGYEVDCGDEVFPADAVVLATPAFESGRLVRALNGAAASELSAIPYVSTAVAILVYPEGTGERLPEGSGFIVPADGEHTIAACTWLSRKWPREEFGGRAVLRCYVGRAGAEEALEMGDQRLLEAVVRDVEAMLPLGIAPDGGVVVRWNRSMPQYELGHLARVERIERALEATPGLFVAGSAYRGVGISDCVRQAEEVAARVSRHLGVPPPSGTTVPVDGTPGTEREAVSWTM
jgi:protoporphyrinogen/coproporphyrinogen III oxidase